MVSLEAVLCETQRNSFGRDAGRADQNNSFKTTSARTRSLALCIPRHCIPRHSSSTGLSRPLRRSRLIATQSAHTCTRATPQRVLEQRHRTVADAFHLPKRSQYALRSAVFTPTTTPGSRLTLTACQKRRRALLAPARARRRARSPRSSPRSRKEIGRASCRERVS